MAYSKAQLQAMVQACNVLSTLFLLDPSHGELSGTATTSFMHIVGDMDCEVIAAWPLGGTRATDALLDLKKAACAHDERYLGRQYRELFVGPNHLAAPPWGSVYMDRECVMFGETTAMLRDWMRHNGVRWVASESTPVDHIGYLLALLAWLCRERPELVDEFLQQHLLTWADHYLTELERAADEASDGENDYAPGTGFYAALARLTRATLAAIRSMHGLDVAEVRYYR